MKTKKKWFAIIECYVAKPADDITPVFRSKSFDYDSLKDLKLALTQHDYFTSALFKKYYKVISICWYVDAVSHEEITLSPGEKLK